MHSLRLVRAAVQATDADVRHRSGGWRLCSQPEDIGTLTLITIGGKYVLLLWRPALARGITLHHMLLGHA